MLGSGAMGHKVVAKVGEEICYLVGKAGVCSIKKQWEYYSTGVRKIQGF